MAKIKHLAISTQDPDKTARFYIDVLGLKEVGKVDSPNSYGYHLSDGNIDLAILKFRKDEIAGAEFGVGYSGLHHIGFRVESLEETAKDMEAANLQPRDDINKALGTGMGGPHRSNVEVKYGGPDGVMIDLSETGWVGNTE